MLTNIFDQSSDIGVIFGLYALTIKESNKNEDCPNINASYLLILSLTFFLFYRIVSAVAVLFGTKQISFAIGQFLVEFMLYRAVWVNYILKCEKPCSPQRWLQNMESMLEAFPQLIIQMFFLVQSESNNGIEAFVMVSIFFSMLSMTNKAVSEDCALFRQDWQDAEWKLKKERFVSPKYVIRSFFRIFDISCRIVVIIIVWSQFGGFIIFIVGGIEFISLILMAIITKELPFVFFLSIICFFCLIFLPCVFF